MGENRAYGEPSLVPLIRFRESQDSDLRVYS
jgi:hypothetical protein